MINVEDLDSLAEDELQELLTYLKHESIFLNNDMLTLQTKADLIQKQILILRSQANV